MSPNDVRAVPAGLEITFFESCKLQAFVENAPEDWKITSDCTGAKIVTLSPKIGTGHVLVLDRVLWTCMERFGRVVEAKRNVWAEAEGFTVESGTISFKIELEPARKMGLLTRQALACRTRVRHLSVITARVASHTARNCKKRVCYKCRGKGSPQNRIQNCLSFVMANRIASFSMPWSYNQGKATEARKNILFNKLSDSSGLFKLLIYDQQ